MATMIKAEAFAATTKVMNVAKQYAGELTKVDDFMLRIS